MDRTSLIEKFRGLTVWNEGGKRAPHKPLLVLLALGYLQREGRWELAYTEIEAPLQKRFADFEAAVERVRSHLRNGSPKRTDPALVSGLLDLTGAFCRRTHGRCGLHIVRAGHSDISTRPRTARGPVLRLGFPKGITWGTVTGRFPAKLRRKG